MGMRANFEKSYLWRYILMGSALFAFAAWFAYDGWIGYPKKLEIAREYEKLADLDDQVRAVRWEQIVREKGWSPQIPEHWDPKDPEKAAKKIEEDIAQQHYFSIGSFVLGLIPWLYFLKNRTTWIERTDGGLKTSWGQTVDFSKVSRLDKRRWEKKGIARVSYADDAGASQTFVFDDFKYQRQPLGSILRDLESVLSDDQIVGGKREATGDSGERSA